MINFFSLIHVLVHTCAKKLYPLYGDGITHRFLLCCSGLMVQARLPAAKTELESKKEPDLEERQFLFQYLSCFERKILFFFFFQAANCSNLSRFTTEVGTVNCSLPPSRTSYSRNIMYSSVSTFGIL